MAEEIIARKEALAQGLKWYFTGEICVLNHISKRLVSNWRCSECLLLATKKYWDSHPEKRKERNKKIHQRQKNNPEKERERQRLKRLRNPETAKARHKRYRKSNPEKSRQTANNWKEKNRERSRQITRDWRQKNPEAGRLWHVNNREKSRASVRNRYARKIGAVGSHTTAELDKILRDQNFRCVYCFVDLSKVKRHVDHIQPLARGGSNDKTNLQYACSSCNQKKQDKDPFLFAQELGRLL